MPAAAWVAPAGAARRARRPGPGLALALASLVLSTGLYAALWGFELSLSLVAGMLAHELGHVAALHRFGFSTGAPLFVPFVGATVRAPRQPEAPRQALAVALAGPAAGLAFAGALGSWAAATGHTTLGWLALALVGLNLCDLLPLPLLDGGRALAALRALRADQLEPMSSGLSQSPSWARSWASSDSSSTSSWDSSA